MNEQAKALLEELVSKITDKNEFALIQKELKKRGVEALLNAELEAHLAHQKGEDPSSINKRNGFSEKTLKTYEGEQRIKIPRDRQGSFDPVIVPKHKTMTEELESTIILLYAKGVSTSDIVDFIERTYGIDYSTTKVSIITNELLENIRAWQIRPLEDQYAVVWIDAIHYKIRHEGKVISKACMVVLGINLDGQQDILSLTIVETESAAAWMAILDDLKSRGVQDIIFLCSDNLSGLEKAIEAVFPKSIRQICIVHQVRNSLKYVSYKDRKAVAADIKEIYRSNDEESARFAFEQFRDNWGHKYHQAINSWESNWENLTAFLQYPTEVRKLIYTTNIIESFNSCLRKYTKNKKVFPNDAAALKSIYLAFQQIESRWSKTRTGWAQIYNQLYITFGERINPTK